MWWIFAIDTHSLLTGSGKGEYAESILRNGVSSLVVPRRQAFGSRRLSVAEVSGRDRENSVLDFHRTILMIAARLGLVARDLRAEYTQVYDHTAETANMRFLRRQQQVTQLQDTLRQTWHGRLPTLIAMGHGNKMVPVEARGIFEHVSSLPSHSLLSEAWLSQPRMG